MSERRESNEHELREGTRHVVPAESDPDHSLDGLCWCQPIYEDIAGGGRLYIHRRTLDSPHRENS